MNVALVASGDASPSSSSSRISDPVIPPYDRIHCQYGIVITCDEILGRIFSSSDAAEMLNEGTGDQMVQKCGWYCLTRETRNDHTEETKKEQRIKRWERR